MAEPVSASPAVEEDPTPSSPPAFSAVEPSLREESEPVPTDSGRRTDGRKKVVKIKVVMLHGSDVVMECEVSGREGGRKREGGRGREKKGSGERMILCVVCCGVWLLGMSMKLQLQ